MHCTSNTALSHWSRRAALEKTLPSRSSGLVLCSSYSSKSIQPYIFCFSGSFFESRLRMRLLEILFCSPVIESQLEFGVPVNFRRVEFGLTVFEMRHNAEIWIDLSAKHRLHLPYFTGDKLGLSVSSPFLRRRLLSMSEDNILKVSGSGPLIKSFCLWQLFHSILKQPFLSFLS